MPTVLTLILKPWYNNTNPLGHTLTWEKGRQLKSFDTNTYTYNANGIRTSKTVNGDTHTFKLDGSKILAEECDDGEITTLWDNEDNVCGINYNSNIFYFLKNLQGDIIAITDEDGDVVARYSYDAWGVPTIVSDTTTVGIATVNPFRYRGYYYDSEIGMYYLQSRYYNPVVGRFVNADEAYMIFYNKDASTLSFYHYCLNCPVNFVDSSGKIALTITLSAVAATTLLNALFALFFAFVAISILSDPGFQKALADAIEAMGSGIRSLSNAVVKAIDSALDKAKKKKRDNRYERHHIVAQSSSNSDAVKSRQLINRVGIGINSSYNLVDIKYNLHRHLHSDAYYKAVYKFLKRTEGSFSRTVLVLSVIKKALQAASNVCP